MTRQGFRNSGSDIAKSKKVLRDAILSKIPVQTALAKYVTAELNAGRMNEAEAARIFIEAHDKWKQDLNTKIDRKFVENKWDQTDLSNPINMDQALNNPDSITSQQMNAQYNVINETNEIAATTEADINNETTTMLNQQTVTNNKEEEQQATKEHESHHSIKELAKGAAIAALIKGLDDLDGKSVVKLMEKEIKEHFPKLEEKLGNDIEKKLEHALGLGEKETHSIDSTAESTLKLVPSSIRKES